jgi:hypothetical protein
LFSVVITGAASRAAGQAKPGETVIKKATEQIENSPLKIASLRQGAGISPANVPIVGDIFSNHFYPIIDLASGGSMGGMIHSVEQILAQTDKKTKIVPGHGPVATHSDLKDYREMLVQVRQRIEVLVGAGKTMDEAVASAPTKAFGAKWGRGLRIRGCFSLIDSGNANR